MQVTSSNRNDVLYKFSSCYCYYHYQVRLFLILIFLIEFFLKNFSYNISFNNKYAAASFICSGATATCTPASTSRLNCTGSGKIFEIPDPCMNDGGIDYVGDSLEIYCVCNIARFCLSGEACPWRDSTSDTVDDGRTCSTAGLTSSYMANAWCHLWRDHADYNCCYNGYIGF